MENIMKIILIISCLFIFSFEYLHSQSGNAKSLEIGNNWIFFNVTELDSYYLYKKVIGDTVFDGVNYAVIKRNEFYLYERADSLKVYNFNPSDSTETILVDFSLDIGDSLNLALVIDKDSIFVWEKWFKKICLYCDFPGLVYYTKCYTEWIGETYGNGGGLAIPDYTLILDAANIEGNIYGDTTLLSVNKNQIIYPTDFNLFQNYPNPFNPTTKIIYEVPRFGIVKMSIYDLLGNLIETNNYGYKNAGRYYVNFDGSNHSSGIYIYQIQYENNIKTNKMLLLK